MLYSSVTACVEYFSGLMRSPPQCRTRQNVKKPVIFGAYQVPTLSWGTTHCTSQLGFDIRRLFVLLAVLVSISALLATASPLPSSSVLAILPGCVIVSGESRISQALNVFVSNISQYYHGHWLAEQGRLSSIPNTLHYLLKQILREDSDVKPRGKYTRFI